MLFTTDFTDIPVTNTIVYSILYVVIGVCFTINDPNNKIINILKGILIGTPLFFGRVFKNLIEFLKELS